MKNISVLKRYGLMALIAVAVATAALLAGAGKNPEPITCTKPTSSPSSISMRSLR